MDDYVRISVLLPLAVDESYCYHVATDDAPAYGQFVRVPFRGGEYIGVAWENHAQPTVDAQKIRNIINVLDAPPLSHQMRQFIDWVARYNMIPRGVVLRMVLGRGEGLNPAPVTRAVRLGRPGTVRRTPARQRVMAQAIGGGNWSKAALARAAQVSPSVITGLIRAGGLEEIEITEDTHYPALDAEHVDPVHGAVVLNDNQRHAADLLAEGVNNNNFKAFLLEGITGSGKTEVYFDAIAATLKAGRQSLILLPEIALTAQFLARFAARFGGYPAQYHSELSPSERIRCWRMTQHGQARVVVGARSALFLPFTDLGLIIVDEEHDGAYKQEERGNYHARDMAVVRGHIGRFPVVLASATPSIETRVNANSGRYQHLRLTSRFSGAQLPDIHAIDLRNDPPTRGAFLSPILLAAIADNLAAGHQTILFLNRRGYAPLTLCRNCGFRLNCRNCAAWLVIHKAANRLSCHHCGAQRPIPPLCPSCGGEACLVPCGPGVERIGAEVAAHFPDSRSLVLSSDFTGDAAQLRERFAQISAGHYQIIVGTQLIAKGHHFPGVSLVGVVDADLGLGHSDLRAAEHSFQLLTQVTGRAGRGAIAGRGFIQTHMPEHPVIQALLRADSEGFYAAEIAERARYGYPPFGRLAAIIVSAKHKQRAYAHAQKLAWQVPSEDQIRVLGPVEAPLAVLRGQHRFRLLVRATRQVDLQSFIRRWRQLAGAPRGGVRVVVDIDPQSFL